MTRVLRTAAILATLLGLAAGCRAAPPAQLELEVVRRIARAPAADAPLGHFTQGLLWHADRLYESTGGRSAQPYGPSRLQEVRIADDVAHVVRVRTLDGSLFGEGLARVGEELVQLTWQAGRALRWQRETFEPVGAHRYSGEGWGLCHDGRRLVMSDGSARLTFRDPATLDESGSVRVTLDGAPLERLNELECVGETVWANVWQEDRIVRIDPDSGRVTGVLDASGLLTAEERRQLPPDAVLNGIAWRPEQETFLITGKLWPALFEVRIR